MANIHKYRITYGDGKIFDFQLKDGADGAPGKNGDIGKSALDIWREETGNPHATEEEFLEALKGEDGNYYEFIYIRSTDSSCKDDIEKIKDVLNSVSSVDYQNNDFPFTDVEIPNATETYSEAGIFKRDITVTSTQIYTMSDNALGINDEYTCEWVLSRGKTDTWQLFGNPTVWSLKGSNGRDGDGIEYAYFRTNITDLDWETFDNLTDDKKYLKIDCGQDDEGYTKLNNRSWTFNKATKTYTNFVWTDNPKGVNSTYPSEYVAIRKKNHETGLWGYFSIPALWAHYGEKGDPGEPGKDAEDSYNFEIIKSEALISYDGVNTDKQLELQKSLMLDVEVKSSKEVRYNLFDYHTGNKNLIDNQTMKAGDTYIYTDTASCVPINEAIPLGPFVLKMIQPSNNQEIGMVDIPFTYNATGGFSATTDTFSTLYADSKGDITALQQNAQQIRLLAGGYENYVCQTAWFRKQIKNLPTVCSALGLTEEDINYVQVFQVKQRRSGTTSDSHYLVFQIPVLAGEILTTAKTYLIYSTTKLNPSADIYSVSSSGVYSITGNFGNDKYTLQELKYTQITLSSDITQYVQDSEWKESCIDLTKSAVNIVTENLTIDAKNVTNLANVISTTVKDLDINAENVTGVLGNATIKFDNVDLTGDSFKTEVSKCSMTISALDVTTTDGKASVRLDSINGFKATVGDKYLNINSNGIEMSGYLNSKFTILTNDNTKTQTFTIGYPIEDNYNLMVDLYKKESSSTKSITIYLPFDPEYEGTRITILNNPISDWGSLGKDTDVTEKYDVYIRNQGYTRYGMTASDGTPLGEYDTIDDSQSVIIGIGGKTKQLHIDEFKSIQLLGVRAEYLNNYKVDDKEIKPTIWMIIGGDYTIESIV